MSEDHNDFSIKSFFVPFSVTKAIHILIVIGLIVYSNILMNGFVWDDLTYIIGNPELQTVNLIKLVGPNTFNSSGYFRPLPAIYFSLLYHLFGNTAFFYHLIQMLLHIGCAILLFILFKKILKPSLAFFLSLVFLVHPVNVESVAYIGATQSQLYFLMGGFALLFGIKDKLTVKNILFTHLFLLLALFTKEVAILYFFLIYLFRYLFKKPVTKAFIGSTLITLAGYLGVRVAVLGTLLHRMDLIPISQISLVGRLMHIPAIIFYYLKSFFYPHTFAIDQIWTITRVTMSNFGLPLIVDLVFFGVILAIILDLWYHSRSIFRTFIFFFIWFLMGLSFLLQIFPLDMTVADRWFYFPIVGLLGMLGFIYDRYIIIYFKSYSKTIFIGVITLVILFSLQTIRRNSDWLNPLTLYSHDVKEYDNYDIENYLGAELVTVNRTDEALIHFKKSAVLLPHDTNLYNVGSVYESKKDFPNAEIYYQRALAEKNINNRHSEVRKLAYQGLIKIMLLQDQPDQTNSYAKSAVNEFPDNGTLWAYLAINEYKLKHQDSAVSAAKKALDLLPNPTTTKLYQRILDHQPIDLKLE